MTTSVDVQLESVTKRFGAVTAVNAVSLEVAPGEVLALLGPSGCGKTTTLRMIAGFEDPDAGLVRIKGAVVNDVPTYRRNLGMVFQHYALFPHMSVLENVGFGLKLKKVPKEERHGRSREMLDIVGLAGMERRRPQQLSGGQQQRVALARAIAAEPGVLLFDEPLSNLDAQLRAEMRAEIRELHTRLGLTSIYVTHDQAEAMALSDLVCVMDQGRMLQLGTPVEIYERPASARVALFIGSANLIAARVVSRRGKEALVETQGGERLVVDDGGEAPEGAAVALCIRPEQIGLSPLSAPPHECRNLVNGKVVKRFYVGSAWEYQVEACHQMLRVAAPVEADIQPGKVVELSLDPKKLRVIAGPPGAA
jgi:ABC-type Fe3+/spermidine/putrescine transport system ATPase subunit